MRLNIFSAMALAMSLNFVSIHQAQAMNANACEAALSFLGRTTEPLIIDIKPDNLSDGLQSFRQLLIHTNPEEFDAIWEMVSKEDLNRMLQMAQDGELKVSENQLNRLNALVHFVNADKNNSLWDEDGAWSSLHSNYPQFIPPAHRGSLDGNIGGVSTYTLGELEKEILERLSGVDNRLEEAGFWRRLANSPYEVAQTIIKYNNQIRERLEHIQEAPREMENEIAEEEANLTMDEKVKIRAAIHGPYGIYKERRELREELTEVYGQDITTGGFQAITGTGVTNIYDIYERLVEGNFIQSEISGEFIQVAESAMQTLEEVLNSARARNGQPERTEADQGLYQLRVRHHEHRRDYKRELADWQSKLAIGIDHYITVSYYWYETEIYYETETYTDANGKTQTRSVMKTRQVRKDATASQQLDFHDILVNRGSRYSNGSSYKNGTIDGTRGWGNIMDETKALYEAEQTIYKSTYHFKDYLNLLEDHDKALVIAKRDPVAKQARLDEIQGLLDNINFSLNSLTNIHMKHGTLWPPDEATFLPRNQELLEALLELKELVEVYEMQWYREEFELITTPEVKDHSEILNKIKWRHFRAITLATGGGAATAAVGLCTGHHFITNYDSCLQSLWQLIEPWLGSIQSLF